MKNLLKTAMLGTALAVALPSTASAATLILTLTDVPVNDEFLDADNVVAFFDIGAFSEVTGFSYDVEIFADFPSYLSEASIYYTDSAITAGVVTRPGFLDSFSGTGTYTGSADLVALGLNFTVGADGLLRIEFADSFDDYPDDFDDIINGTITFEYTPLVGGIPEPATWAMMIGGIGAAGGALRRRSARKLATA